MLVIGIRECHQEARVGDTLHDRENPLRVDRSRIPRTEPASLINEGSLPPSRAFSGCSRTMRPFGIPDCFDACSSQVASSLVSRIVTVLLIWRKCNTYGRGLQKGNARQAPGNGLRPARPRRWRPDVRRREADTRDGIRLSGQVIRLLLRYPSWPAFLNCRIFSVG